LKYIRQIQKGDLALIYHTGEEKAIVGIAEVTGAAYATPNRRRSWRIWPQAKAQAGSGRWFGW
jgi:predicted RNA-binding protein with PUA-like domain